jgi:hypothetical protein
MRVSLLATASALGNSELFLAECTQERARAQDPRLPAAYRRAFGGVSKAADRDVADRSASDNNVS